MQWEAFGLRTQATGQRFFYAIIAIILLPLCGCGSIGGGKSAAVSSPISKPALSGGGYYRNDGPEANPPAHLELVPDAQPKLEPLNRATSRPYTILGHEYIPMSALGPYRVRGVASWYGRRYHKQMTASGEFYDMYAMTAAHTTLPIPSYARVTRLSTGQSVVVRINDRGPFVDNRLIDLSYTAAFKLGILAGGNDVVEVESVVPGSTLARPVLPASGPAVATPSRTEVPTVAPARIAPPATVVGEGGRIYLQLAAFASPDNARAFVTRLDRQSEQLSGQLQVVAREGLYRVQWGPFANTSQAKQAAEQISQWVGSKPILQAR